MTAGSQPLYGWLNGTTDVGVREFMRLRSLTCTLVGFCALIQFLFFAAVPDNLETLFICTCSSLLGLMYTLDIRRFQSGPVSSLILLFFNLTSVCGALIAKTVEFTPLVDRLNVPILTFSVMAYAQLILILAHAFYLNNEQLQKARTFCSTQILSKVGIFNWPTNSQLWAMGALGCISIAAFGSDYEAGAQFGSAVAGQKFFRSFAFLRFAPFLIPFRVQLSEVTGPLPRHRSLLLMLAAYFGCLVAISFATNSRSTFADALPTAAIAGLLALSSGKLQLKRIPRGKILVTLVAGSLMMLLLSRIALAMVVARAYRDSVDAAMLVNLTIEAVFNSEWINTVKDTMDASVSIGFYSEDYVNSRFLSRFLLTKFHDNMLQYFSLFGPDEVNEYWQLLGDQITATLPDPVLGWFGINLDKGSMLYSNGDYAVYLVDGWGLGGFKTGSFLSEYFSLLGWWFGPGLFLAAVMLFVAYDCFVWHKSIKLRVFSPLILMLIWNLCGTTAAFGLGAESMHQLPSGIVRGVPQNIALYLLAKLLTGVIVRPLNSNRGLMVK